MDEMNQVCITAWVLQSYVDSRAEALFEPACDTDWKIFAILRYFNYSSYSYYAKQC